MAVDSSRPQPTDFTDIGGESLPTSGARSRTYRQKGNLYLILALMASDFGATVAAIVLGYVLRFHAGLFPYEQFHPLGGYAGLTSLQMLVLPLILAANRLYHPIRAVSWLDQTYGVFTSVSVATALVLVLGGLLWPDAVTSRLMIGLVWALNIVLILLGRILIQTGLAVLRSHGMGVSRTLLIGNGDAAHLVVERMYRNPRLGYHPIGVVVEEPGPTTAFGLPILGSIGEVGALVRQYQIDDVFVATETLAPKEVLNVVSQCGTERVNIRVFPDVFQIMTSGVSTGELDGLPLVTVKDVALKGFNLVLKRGLDLVGSAIGLVLLSPVLLLIALLIKITSPGGPVFHLQERVGLDGRPFLIIKFRSMRPDAEAKTGAVWATPDDPRKTRLGTWLRRLSLDELPQLINVLLGDMSLVGPRPERPVFVEQFSKTVPRYFERHAEKAGLTGWAQVNGLRGHTPIEDRTAYDLWYVENWTLWLDIKIILKTLLVVFRDKNAY